MSACWLQLLPGAPVKICVSVRNGCDWCVQVFLGELMYMTRCDKGCVINNENTTFWKLTLSLADTHAAVVDVVGDRESTHFISFRCRRVILVCEIAKPIKYQSNLDEAQQGKNSGRLFLDCVSSIL